MPASRLHPLNKSLRNTIKLQASCSNEYQSLFADGLLWCYGFHHEEAQRQFRQLIKRSPECPLAYWGLAYSMSPFYNRPWTWFAVEEQQQVASSGYENIRHAQSLLNNDTQTNPLQARLLDNLALVYRQPEPPDNDTYQIWQSDYADAMLALAQDYSEHPDITSLAVEALMTCTPWQLWNTQNGTPANNSRITEALQLLEPALEQNHHAQPHLGLRHMHIHAMEMSPWPERAQQSADQLRALFVLEIKAPSHAPPHLPPHLPHMATHIDVLTGNYKDAIETNRNAALHDLQIDQYPDEFYQISRLHNLHLMLSSAMMAGRENDASHAQQNIETIISKTDDKQCDNWLSVSIEGFYANRLHLDVRFGHWKKLADVNNDASSSSTQETSDNTNHFADKPFARAMQSYARAIALANLTKQTAAEQEFDQFIHHRDLVPDWYIINNNPAKEILAVAEAMIAGESLYHKQAFSAGLDKLREAVDLHDALSYCEPWPWMHPPRHALGALLLEQGDIAEATEIYEIDLGINDILPRCLQHPNNVWSLAGLAECYSRSKLRSKHALTVESINNKLTAALSYADITIRSSCLCRKSGCTQNFR